MKRFFYSAIFLFFISGCSSNDTSAPTIPSTMPMSSFVGSKTMPIYKYAGSNNGAALGFEFKVKANAFVTGLGCASPTVGTYNLTLFQVDSVNKSGKLLTTTPITIGVADTASFKFTYVALANKISISKGVYYRIAINGDFTAYDYLTFPTGNQMSLPLPLPTNSKFIFTNGVAGYANQYPDTEFSTYMFPADVVIQFP
ncbi:MAG TPA: hypothetical protein VL728_09060 [Cyclobacteriaceae bacterium]|nr:hypothetical protein [Cyclobacteriaceae bacterium]